MILDKLKNTHFLVALTLIILLLSSLSYLFHQYLNSPQYLVYHKLKGRQFQDSNTAHDQEVKTILSTQLGIAQNTPDIKKLEKITRYVIKKTFHQRGAPKNADFYNDPYQGWQKVINQESKIYCSHFVDFVAMFAQAAGLNVREVHLRHINPHMEKNTNYYRHVVLEVLIDNKWVVSDPYFKLAYVKKGDNYLSAYELLRAEKKDQLNYYFALKKNDIVLSPLYSQMIQAYKHRYFNQDFNKLVLINFSKSNSKIEVVPKKNY